MTKYTVAQIDDMRSALYELLYPRGGWDHEEGPREVERQLRTYMLNGTTPEELWEEAVRRAPAKGEGYTR